MVLIAEPVASDTVFIAACTAVLTQYLDPAGVHLAVLGKAHQ